MSVAVIQSEICEIHWPRYVCTGGGESLGSQ